MSHIIIIDELVLKECVESNIYQSLQFETGETLAKVLSGDNEVRSISSRLIPVWKKGVLYLLQSRVETGYLIIDSQIFDAVKEEGFKGSYLDDVLLVFQRICRFALKDWNGLNLSFTERWSQKTGCGVIFPYPKSRQTGFKVVLKKIEAGRRISVRHGSKQLFAFAGGVDEDMLATAEQERAYTKSMEELSSVRIGLESEIVKLEKQPADLGYHPLILSDKNHSHIRYQSFDDWLNRLTKHQKAFVVSADERPQRVEGPAGTGKTLSLLLRSFFLCRNALQADSEFRVLFVAHSEATKNATKIAFDALGEPYFHSRNRNECKQTIELCTLQEWCGQVLGSKEISNAQYLDQDALSAKELRKLIIKDVVLAYISETKTLDYLSPECRDFFSTENRDYVAELLQHEIGVMIKGRASERLEAYLELPTLDYCLPVKTNHDRQFVYAIYREYQKQLNLSGVFDTDDIVLSTLGRLDTPIWRRRRATEGFDAVVIDETHLFNFNELAVFHHILRVSEKPRIIFSIDRSQATGERGITTRLVRNILTRSANEEAETRTQIVFRSSPAIVRLAEAVTSAGATLFTTFENPLLNASSVISATDEEMAQECIYWKCGNDGEMCKYAVVRAKLLCKQLKCPPNEILLIATTESLLPILGDALKTDNSPFIQILQRGDLEAVKKGEKEGAYIVSHPDYVGGLEFRGVLMIGVDDGRLPPFETGMKTESKHFAEFKACNRLYVAISRARLAVELFYSGERGRSALLNHARSIGVITEKTSV